MKSEPPASAGGPASNDHELRNRVLGTHPLTQAVLTSLVKLAGATGVAWRRHAKQSISSRCKPLVEDWSQFGKWPDCHHGRQPLPTRQYSNHFNPGKVTFGPASLAEVRVHLVGHLLTCSRRRAFENFRIVVIQPLNAMVAIQRLNPRPHPAAKVTVSVGINFDLVQLTHDV